MIYKAILTANARKDLLHLENQIATQVLDKLMYFLKSGNFMQYAKKLKGFAEATYRFRAGDYRIIFCVDSKTKELVVLIILHIAHRKKAYS